jgi:hypothetical protein
VVKTCTIETKGERCLSVDLLDKSFAISTCVVRLAGKRGALKVDFSVFFEDKNNS